MTLKTNLYNFCNSLIPAKIRTRSQRIKALAYSMIFPLQMLNDSFAAWGNRIRYELSFNGQQIYLEHLLNDAFDPNNRGIYIEDPAIINSGIIALYYSNENAEETHTYFDNEIALNNYTYYDGELNSLPHFIVKIPTNLYSQQLITRLNALILKYKIAGKQYITVAY